MDYAFVPSSSGSSGNLLEPSTFGKQLSTEEPEPLGALRLEEPCSEDDVSFNSGTQISENGTQYWTPTCSEELKPCTGMSFPSDVAGNDFYYRYGVQCGFDIRRGPTKKHRDGTVLTRYIYCNKEGFVVNNSFDNANGKRKNGSRNCTSSRCGCQAKLVIKWKGASDYKVTEFVERHNHSMVSLDAAQFLKCRRKMNPQHKRFVVGCGKANLGSVRSYKLSKHLVGGSNVVAFIGLDDAQLVLNKLVKKKQVCSSFYYEYSVVKGALSRIFWADSISQLNFHSFGDVLTFDATYSLNRYNMIFVPFTGIDNHKKSVTFAAALLSNEDVESYTWMLECFKKCMARAPQIVLTDQDPALRAVVPKVMPNAHHRYCIWHIMNKLSVKVGFNTPELQQFRKKLKTIVYDYHVETSEFEKNWKDVIAEYGMGKNKWLSSMFRIRKLWIPAYFCDIQLGGLLRMTSRSESENSFFGSYLNQRLTLVGFFMGFDVALENQRQIRSTCDHEAMTKRSRIRTPLLIELHALQTYTTTIFQEVQTEICASCFDVSITTVVESENGKVHEAVAGTYKLKTFQVTADSSTDSFLCTCKLFERVGYQCRHVFAALKYARIEKIPERYVLNRWTRDAIQTVSQSLDPILVEDCQVIQQAGMVDQDLWMDFNTCLSIADNDNVKREYIRCKVKEMLLHLEQLSSGHRVASKTDIISDLIGSCKPIERTVNSPALVHTKGSGKRLASNFDVAIKKSQRAPRMCKSGVANTVAEVQSGTVRLLFWSCSLDLMIMLRECSLELTLAVDVVQSVTYNALEEVQSGTVKLLLGKCSLEHQNSCGICVVWNCKTAVAEVQSGTSKTPLEFVQSGTLKLLLRKCSLEHQNSCGIRAVWSC
ncbi:hypothetical protein QQ045_001081 [Rhodiola kirilowii]